MPYENNLTLSTKPQERNFTVFVGNLLKNLTVMALMKNLIQTKCLKSLKSVKLKEWLFVTAANPANSLFVMVLTQNYEHRF